MGPRVGLLLLLLALAPVASAGAPVKGWASFSSDLSLEGAARFSTSEGALDLSAALPEDAPLDLSWASASGRLVTTDWTDAKVRWDVGVQRPGDKENRSLRFGAASVVGVSCAGTCQVLVLSERDGGSLSLLGDAQGFVRWLEEPRLYWANWKDPAEGAFVRRFEAGTLLAGGSDLPVGGARAEAEGRLGLFFENATLVLETAEGERVTLDATTRRSAVAHLPGGARVEAVTSRFVHLELEGARLSLDAAEDAVLLAPRLHADLAEGAMSAGRARGHVSYAGHRGSFSGEPLDVAGALSISLRARPDAGPDEGQALLSGRTLEAGFEGEATSIRAGAFRAAEPPPAASSATGATLGLALLATLPWWLPRFVLAPLYSRIHRGSVLENPNRNALHRLVGEDPGRTPAELARRLGLARIVVRHHLRMLESHRLVSCRPDGRKRRYYLPDAPLGEETALQLLLREGPRRKVAEALVAASAPLTQQQIADRTGLSPRLVSYHLGRLATLDVVERQGSRPAAYALRAPAAAILRGRVDG